MNILEYLQNPYIILLFITIVIFVIIIGCMDDKLNKNNKKSIVGYTKLVLLCLICSLGMLIALIQIIKTGKLKVRVNNFNFDMEKITGEPGF